MFHEFDKFNEFPGFNDVDVFQSGKVPISDLSLQASELQASRRLDGCCEAKTIQHSYFESIFWVMRIEIRGDNQKEQIIGDSPIVLQFHSFIGPYRQHINS